MRLCKGKATLRVLVAALTLATGFGAASAARAADAHFVLISHAPDSDSWWNTIKNAVKQAGEDFDVTVDYRNPPSGDLADMSRLIEQAAAQNYDGVITSIASPTASASTAQAEKRPSSTRFTATRSASSGPAQIE